MTEARPELPAELETLLGDVRRCIGDNQRFLSSLHDEQEPDEVEEFEQANEEPLDRKSTRLNSSHLKLSRMPSSA